MVSEVEELTEHCSGMLLNICLSYGGRNEIIGACRQIAQVEKYIYIYNPSSYSQRVVAPFCDVLLLFVGCGGRKGESCIRR